MKLWDKGQSVEDAIERFTVGRDRELDLYLAPWDVLGSLAHIQMLASIDLLGDEEVNVLQGELRRIYRDIEKGEFAIEPGVEDVHSQVELILTERLGEVGKKIHSGRSRNDQVLLDLKLYMRHQLEETARLVRRLFDSLIELSETHRDVLIPGYTHFQVAMPSSFGLWFGAYAESLVDDMVLLQAAYKIIDKNPLGSAAGYGSSFPLDREMTTELLGFARLNYNSVYAQMGRGKAERTVSVALAAIGATLNKLAADVCLFMCQNFAFLTFPDHLTTGSSIMPHKKNPDVFELIRARSNRIQSFPYQISLLGTNLPSGYHRDMQLLKEGFIPNLEEVQSCLEMARFMLEQVEVKEGIVENSMYRYLFSVEEVNRLVLQGVPFRDAYRQVGKAIEEKEFNPTRKVNHTHIGSVGNLANDRIQSEMDDIFYELKVDFERADLARKNLLG